MVYVDEAQDYFDQNIGVILSQARKYKVGMIMAHQYLGQLSNGLQEAFEANTSIKLAGGVSARDARALAGQMASSAEKIQEQPKGTFATYVRGLTNNAVPISFPFFVLENLPRASKDEIAEVREHSRKTYAEPLRKMAEPSEPTENEEAEKPEEKQGDDPTSRSTEF